VQFKFLLKKLVKLALPKKKIGLMSNSSIKRMEKSWALAGNQSIERWI